MITEEENRLLTQSGRGTPGGTLLRQYWQPAALSEELDGPRPIVTVRLMGEDLVLFRNEAGELGLIGRSCAHRRADLSFGRLEDGGLRCPFHGWLFDCHGGCQETPAEPMGSTLASRVTQPSYPVAERSGIIWAWLGEGEPPELPGIDAMVAPEAQVFAFKGMWDCNWLQAQEVGIDPSHASFLHRFLKDEDEKYGLQFRALVADTGIPTTKLLREVANPEIQLEKTASGFRLVTLRNFRDEFTHVRITNCLFPNAIVIPMSGEMTITQWHVPIDDERCFWYSVFVSYGDPVDAVKMREQRIGAITLPDYRPKTQKENAWGYDPVEQDEATYTGLGTDINVHDQWAVESPGPIHDRTREHLSPADVGIRTQRRMMLAAMKDPSSLVRPDPASLNGPGAIDAVDTEGQYDQTWRSLEAARRTDSGWAPELAE